MAVLDQNVELWNSEHKTFTFTVRDESAVVVNITGVTVAWRAARHPSATAVITKVGTVSNGPAGQFTVSVAPSDNAALDGSYIHEARFTDVGGNVTVATLGSYVVNRSIV